MMENVYPWHFVQRLPSLHMRYCGNYTWMNDIFHKQQVKCCSNLPNKNWNGILNSLSSNKLLQFTHAQPSSSYVNKCKFQRTLILMLGPFTVYITMHNRNSSNIRLQCTKMLLLITDNKEVISQILQQMWTHWCILFTKWFRWLCMYLGFATTMSAAKHGYKFFYLHLSEITN